MSAFLISVLFKIDAEAPEVAQVAAGIDKAVREMMELEGMYHEVDMDRVYIGTFMTKGVTGK